MSKLQSYEDLATFENDAEKSKLKNEFDKALEEANAYYGCDKKA